MRAFDKFIITSPNSIWLHLAPEDQIDVALVGVFSLDGQFTVSPDLYSFDVADNMIKIDFGLTRRTGYAIYSYTSSATDPAAGGIVINNGMLQRRIDFINQSQVEIDYSAGVCGYPVIQVFERVSAGIYREITSGTGITFSPDLITLEFNQAITGFAVVK